MDTGIHVQQESAAVTNQQLLDENQTQVCSLAKKYF